jgi:hypothetical protein
MSQKNRHEDQIPQFISHLICVTVFHRVYHFVDFLKKVTLDSGGGLLSIPGTAVLGSEPGHKFQQHLKFSSRLSHLLPLRASY